MNSITSRLGAIEPGVVLRDGMNMRVYRVEAGDSISSITPKLLGLPVSEWRVLWGYNPQIEDPNVIQVGDPIYFPSDTSVAEQSVQPTGVAATKKPILQQPLVLAGASGALVLAAILLTRPQKGAKKSGKKKKKSKKKKSRSKKKTKKSKRRKKRK